jgi:uroporphyrinogen decarboxylase
MNGRDRQLATIRHAVPDRISVDAIAIETLADIAVHLGIPVDAGSAAVLDRLGIDGRVILAPYVGVPERQVDGLAELAARAECVYLTPYFDHDPGPPMEITEWGTPWVPHYATHRRFPFNPDSTVRDVEGYAWPDADHYDYQWAARMAHRFASDYAIRGPYWKPLLCQVFDLLGTEEALVTMLSHPRLFEALLERVFTVTAEYVRRFVAALDDDLHILYLGDDFATQRGMMISPQLWRRHLKPLYARLFEMGRRAGKHVWFHACGDITAVLPDLIDIGMDVWETVQLHTLPVSPERLKQEYGRHLTFFGAANTQRLPFMSPAEVAAEVTACIEALGKGGGYICGPDHHIKPDVPHANSVALFETARAFRRPGYTSER